MKIKTPLWALFAVVSATAGAQEDAATPILFTNVNVFDGTSHKLLGDANVVVTGNLITEISTEDLAVAGGQVSDDGRHIPFVMKDGRIIKNNLRVHRRS